MPTVAEIADLVQELGAKLSQAFRSHGWSVDNPLNSYQGYMPAFPASAIVEYATFTAERIRTLKEADLRRDKLGPFLATLPPMITPMQFTNLPSDPDTVVGGLMMLLQMINARLPSEAKRPVPLDWDSVQDKSLLPKDLTKRLRSLESTLSQLEPRAGEVDKKISDIEAAHATAEQLPEDLEELAAKRNEVKQIVQQATDLIESARKLVAGIENNSDASEIAMKRVSEAETKAKRLIERSEQALRGSTGVGLATAFEKRKESLSWAGFSWVVGLLAALIAAFLIGANRVSTLQDLIKNESPAHIIWMNLALTLFGVGGPIWFAWLSTKQIAVSFRLAEDYAFKAAVSKAYEGYRKEAIEIDPVLQSRLFSSALDRLEEAPIRLMEKETHSSPLQELLSNPAIRKGLESIPGITDKIIALIPAKGAAAVVAPVAAVTAAAAGVVAANESNKQEAAE
ncbi:hypothetical protein [Rhizobium binae]|uniref:hypothetical protein n=1 Tax=Rhizobium binae TaxID=1138190 RepID=UPI001C832010|nr:hypothetical protein [Rhizobium binae]MBX4967197.1 hypothetical protein [Rhizobium binae]